MTGVEVIIGIYKFGIENLVVSRASLLTSKLAIA